MIDDKTSPLELSATNIGPSCSSVSRVLVHSICAVSVRRSERKGARHANEFCSAYPPVEKSAEFSRPRTRHRLVGHFGWRAIAPSGVGFRAPKDSGTPSSAKSTGSSPERESSLVGTFTMIGRAATHSNRSVVALATASLGSHRHRVSESAHNSTRHATNSGHCFRREKYRAKQYKVP